MEDVDEQPVVMQVYRDGKEYHSVRFSRDLPPGYQTAWIVALSMAHNDLLRAWRQLVPLVNSTDPVDEGDYVYFARLACSHAYEVTDRLIRRGLKHRLIRPLFSLLGPQENRALKLIQKLALPRGGSWADRTLAPIRNNFSHYNIDAVRSALDAIHRNEPGLVSWYSVGRDWTGDRFFYADEVSGRMVGRSLDEANRVWRHVQTLVQALTMVSGRLIRSYLR
jgi:hypothetical protein